ncbi:MAG: hypothetical protein PHS95_01775 [Candidatus Pacebacteria bacterium]|nr:hypothetical protein [Candidatus Paceibacterota bacterium]
MVREVLIPLSFFVSVIISDTITFVAYCLVKGPDFSLRRDDKWMLIGIFAIWLVVAFVFVFASLGAIFGIVK